MKGLTKLVTMSLVATLSFSAYAWGGGNSTSVGVVDVQKVFSSPDGGPKIQATLDEKFSERRDHLQDLLDKLQAQQKAYQKNKDKLSKAVLSKKEAKFKKDQTQFQKDQTQYQREFAAAQSKAMNKFLNKVKGAAKKVAKKDHLSLVLVKNSVLYAQSTKDVTDEVLDKISN